MTIDADLSGSTGFDDIQNHAAAVTLNNVGAFTVGWSGCSGIAGTFAVFTDESIGAHLNQFPESSAGVEPMRFSVNAAAPGLWNALTTFMRRRA